MSKILVNDLKELSKQTDSVKIIDFRGYPIQIKTYLPIAEKIGLVSSIYKSAIDEDDSLQNISYNSLNIAYKVLVTKAYTDVSLPKDTIQAYDLLVQTNLYDEVYQSIPVEERLELENVFDNFVDEKQEMYERENKAKEQELRIENVIKDGIDELLARLDEFIKKLPEKDQWGNIGKDVVDTVNNLNPSKLKFISQAIGWNNGVEG